MLATTRYAMVHSEALLSARMGLERARLGVEKRHSPGRVSESLPLACPQNEATIAVTVRNAATSIFIHYRVSNNGPAHRMRNYRLPIADGAGGEYWERRSDASFEFDEWVD